ncbi:MAG TPA: isochorismatase family cysteine hydrolase, partial [Anaerolineales bacterium]|nr:isochorismatase family cysteine hydrolase [Anaerolineales bacterium]
DVRKWPVYHVVSQYKADGSDWDLKMKAAGVPELIEGTPEADILPAIDVESRHKVVAKTRYSAFFNTSLAADLQAENVDRAVVVGAYTHYCVNATVFDAYGHNFVPCLLADAVLSHLPRETELLVERMRRNGYHVKPTEAFITSLDQD